MSKHESLEGTSAWGTRTQSIEGIDPCHDNLYRTKKTEKKPPEANNPKLLRFGTNEIVQGFIYSEILARKPIKRGR